MTTDPHTHPHEHPFRGFDESVERTLGADMRLIYGFAVPILVVTGLVVMLALSPATWLVVTIVVIELAALGVVVIGFTGMLNEPADDEGSELEPLLTGTQAATSEGALVK